MTYAIGFCSGYTVTYPFMLSVCQVLQRGGNGLVTVVSGPTLYDSRNTLCKVFLERDYDQLLMVDTDIAFHPEQVDAILAHPSPVATGVYMAADDRVIEAGCGFLKIDRWVIEKLMPFPFNVMTEPDGSQTGEDIAFFRRCLDADIEVTHDYSIKVGHLKPVMLMVKEESAMPKNVTSLKKSREAKRLYVPNKKYG